MDTHVLLLRGIGPPTHKVMTMAALAEACAAAGLPGMRSVLATGNLVVRSDLGTAEVADRVVACMRAGGLRFGLQARRGAAVAAVGEACPFPDAVAVRPAQVQVFFLDGPLSDAGLAALSVPGVALARVGRELVVDYGGPISASALTQPLVDRVLGKAATARNWNTLRRLVTAL